MPNLTDISAARRLILSHFAAVGTERVPLGEADGRVLAEEVRSAIDVPGFDASAMDGFAVRAADIKGAAAGAPVTLKVAGSVATGGALSAELGAAGELSDLKAGEAYAIMTGGALPNGADCVVPFEDTDAVKAGVPPSGEAAFFKSARAGAFVRRRGHDTKKGAAVLSGGARLNAAKIGAAASVGAGALTVHKRPRVAILSTGDELAPNGAKLTHGQIYDANTPLLAAAVRAAGGEPLTRAPIKDTLNGTIDALANLPNCDLVLTTGGVSVGQHDYMKAAARELGEILLWGINVRPGRPTLFATLKAGKNAGAESNENGESSAESALKGVKNAAQNAKLPLLGLAGNPVSAEVMFQLLARPAIRIMSGLPAGELFTIRAQLAEPLKNEGPRQFYARALAERSADGRSWQVTTAKNQESSALGALANSNALIVCPPNADFRAGAEVTALLPAPDDA